MLNSKDILLSFLVGLRFDLSAAGYAFIPLMLLLFTPYLGRNIKFLKGISIIWLTWIIVLTIYLAIDYFYYPFSFRHLSFELANTTGDIMPMLKVGLKEYPWEILFLFIVISFLVYIYPRIHKNQIEKLSARSNNNIISNFIKEASGFLIAVVFIIVSARGGFQMKPMKLSDAFIFNDPFLGHLALNGVYTTFNSYYKKIKGKEKLMLGSDYCSLEEARNTGVGFFISNASETVINPEYPLYRHFNYPAEKRRPLNVVIFIMESWSGKYTGSLGAKTDSTPFMSGLSKDGMLLSNFYANGQRSNEGIPALLTSIPPYGDMILSNSPLLSQMPVKFIPAIFRDYGYKTFFIHGGKLGTMGFNSLARHAGIETYISKNEILQQGAREDGAWGVFDEDAFLYSHRLFAKQDKPFFAVIFSLSSHTPYRLPSGYEQYYGNDVPNADFLNSLRYSDYALSRFFDEAKKSSYFNDTLFVVVGDHAEGKTTQDNIFTRFHIPCLFYSPSIIKPSVIDKTTTQVDIVPTILDILKISAPHASVGSSAIANDTPGAGLLAYGDNMVFALDEWMLISTPERPIGLFKRGNEANKDMSAEFKDKVVEMKKNLDCYQSFINDLYQRNRLFPPRNIVK